MTDRDQLPSEDAVVQRKVRVHKMRPVSAVLDGSGPSTSSSNPTSDQLAYAMAQKDDRLSRAMAEIIPGLADMNLSAASSSQSDPASEALRLRQAKVERAKSEAKELATIFDLTVAHPLDSTQPTEPWLNKQRPAPKKIVLSPYQYEMINYQRMLLRKNIWYYRDRMNVPRGPCPLHVLKDAWVQGVVDEHTLVWGHGLYDWLPAKNVKLLLPMIRTPEVRLGAWMKKTFSLKPTFNRLRETHKDHLADFPELVTNQVNIMR